MAAHPIGLALAMGIPALLLLPWTRLNYVLHKTINPAEHMRSDTNIVSGALGLTVNIEGDIRSLAPEGTGALLLLEVDGLAPAVAPEGPRHPGTGCVRFVVAWDHRLGTNAALPC